MRLKIGIAVNHFHPSIGGAELVVKVLADYLHEHHQVYVFTRRLKGRDQRDYKYKVIEYRPGDLGTFDRNTKDLKLDVLLIYSDVFDFFRHVSIRSNSYRLIIALCGANWLYSHPNYINIFIRNIFHVEALICHSKRERDFKLCSSPRVIDKTVIIPNGLDVTEFDANTLSRKELAPEIADKRWILNVANFFPGKGQEHLVDIIESMPDHNEIAYLQVFSDIDFAIGHILEHKWKKAIMRIKRLGVAVKTLKNLPREKVVGYFKQSNVLACTSEKEVAPIVLLESMGASLPWIATNVGNAQDLEGGICIPALKNARNHSVFDIRVKRLFRDGIQKLCGSPLVGESGRRQVERELNWNSILPQYLSLIERNNAKA